MPRIYVPQTSTRPRRAQQAEALLGTRARRSGTLVPQMSCKPLLAAASRMVETAGQVDGGSRQIGDTTASTALIMPAGQSGTALDVLIRTADRGSAARHGHSAFPPPTSRTKMWACLCSAPSPPSTSSSLCFNVRASSLRPQRPDGTKARGNRQPLTA